MKDKMKKSLGILLATVCMSTVLVGCGTAKYKGDDLGDSYTVQTNTDVKSNGGFAVEQGDYVYFINGKDSYDKSNEYGKVVKSALMRIKTSDLASGDYSDVKTVVPSLFVAQNYDAGIYIYGDYVYYATPTTYNTMEGNVGNTNLDFKRAKLDGKQAPEETFFRLSNNSAKYRFVEVDGTVYCLYEEDSALKSFNTTTKKTTVLVSGAKSSFFYDTENAESPTVYYTMNVKGSINGQNAEYDQLYSVRADATVTNTDKKTASYTVSNGYTYDFDEVAMKEANDEAKEAGNEATYDFSDYTTYPYVNLGTLVLDGVGKSTTKTQFTHDEGTPIETAGYNYTIKSYRDGGLYFTRSAVTKTGSAEENAKLYYVADATVTADGWNTITDNAETALDTVANNTTNTESALFYKDGDKHYYIYLSGEMLYRAGYDNGTDTRIETVQLTKNKIGTATLWKLDKTNCILYYYVAKADGTGNGNTLSQIRYDGAAEDYNALLNKDEFKPLSIDYVDFNNSADWYMPEIIGSTLMYGNVQSFGSTSYTYVYATDLTAISANNEKYENVQEFIKDDDHSSVIQSVMQYYFRTGETALYEEVKEEYSTSQQETITAFVDKFAQGGEYEGALEKNFISLVGKLTEDDEEAMTEAFKDSLEQPDEEEEEDGVEPWVIWTLVGVGSALIIAGVVVTLVIVSKKKKAKQAEEQAIVNAGKRKIDVTDDVTIDVYQEEQPVEEKTEDKAEEKPDEETVAEETAQNEDVKTTDEE